MKALTLDQVVELKKLLSERDAGVIHMHDTCGGQYFSIENETAETKPIIADYAGSKGLAAVFDSLSHGFAFK